MYGNGQPQTEVGGKPSSPHTVEIHTPDVISVELKVTTKVMINDPIWKYTSEGNYRRLKNVDINQIKKIF